MLFRSPILAQSYLNAYDRRVASILGEWSTLTVDPATRAQETMAMMDEIGYGQPNTALRAAEHLWKIHSHLTVQLDDGVTVTAADPDLLGVVLVAGVRAQAAFDVLTTATTLRYVDEQVTEAFLRGWAGRDREGLSAAVGIPQGYLPDDPLSAMQWWEEQTRKNLVSDAEHIRVKDYLDVLLTTVSKETSSKKQRFVVDHLIGIAVRAVEGVVFYAAPEFLRDLAFPKGAPAFALTDAHALKWGDRIEPSWMLGGIQRVCPQSQRVLELLDDEGRHHSG